MNIRRGLTAIGVTVVTLAVACSASEPGSVSDASAPPVADGAAADAALRVDAQADSGAAAPSIDPGRFVSTLSDAEKRDFCDWLVSLSGGYGKVTDCGGGNTVQNPVDQAECVATAFAFRCEVKVSQFEACARVQAPSHGCIAGQAECKPLFC